MRQGEGAVFRAGSHDGMNSKTMRPGGGEEISEANEALGEARNAVFAVGSGASVLTEQARAGRIAEEGLQRAGEVSGAFGFRFS